MQKEIWDIEEAKLDEAWDRIARTIEPSKKVTYYIVDS
jgi:hypothetical protein